MVHYIDGIVTHLIERSVATNMVNKLLLYKDETTETTVKLLYALPLAFLFCYFPLIANKSLNAGNYLQETPQESWIFSYFALTFFITVIFDIIAIMASMTQERKLLSVALVCINSIAFISYFSITTGLSPVMLDWKGNPLYPIRYLEWAFTCPILIVLISKMTYSDINYAVVIVLDIITIACGFFAALCSFPYNVGFLTVALTCFAMVITSLNSMFKEVHPREYFISFKKV